jgi:hypothetical protein
VSPRARPALGRLLRLGDCCARICDCSEGRRKSRLRRYFRQAFEDLGTSSNHAFVFARSCRGCRSSSADVNGSGSHRRLFLDQGLSNEPCFLGGLHWGRSATTNGEMSREVRLSISQALPSALPCSTSRAGKRNPDLVAVMCVYNRSPPTRARCSAPCGAIDASDRKQAQA